MRLLAIVGGTCALVVAASLALHLGAAATSREFFTDYLLPFAEGPQLARANRWTLAAYLGATQAWRFGLVAGVLAYAFATLGGRPPLPSRATLGVVAAIAGVVLAHAGWGALRAAHAGTSTLGLAGDLISVPRVVLAGALALGTLTVYLSRWALRSGSSEDPSTPGSPAAPPAPALGFER